MPEPVSADLEQTAGLLRSVFPESAIAQACYLDWLYCRNPDGRVIEANLDDERGRSGHYALVPCELAEGTERFQAALSLNTAVHERARGGGAFVRLATEAYAGAEVRGVRAVVGVANANSTPGFVKRLGFSLLGSLPARVWLPRPGRDGLDTVVADAELLADEGFWNHVAPLLDAPGEGLSRAWRRESFAWRLASPRGPYAVHLGDGVAAVSVATRIGPLNCAVMLKLLPAAEVGPLGVQACVRAACRHHRAPAVVHAGVTGAVLPAGIKVPERFRPSPLNLIFRWLGDRSDASPPARFADFQFLDFDAY